MKQKSNIVLVLIIIIPIVLLGLLLFNKDPNVSFSKKRILIEKSYSNYAWGKTYKGMAICEDGTIYKWNMDDNYFKSNNILDTASTLEYESNRILKYSHKQINKISQKDMELLKKYISNLNSYMSTEYIGADMGSTVINVWDYSKERKITIKILGDQTGEVETKEAQEIIRIANKYLR